jgi:hypothetical protein
MAAIKGPRSVRTPSNDDCASPEYPKSHWVLTPLMANAIDRLKEEVDRQKRRDTGYVSYITSARQRTMSFLCQWLKEI